MSNSTQISPERTLTLPSLQKLLQRFSSFVEFHLGSLCSYEPCILMLGWGLSAWLNLRVWRNKQTFQEQLKAVPAAPPFGSWGSARLLEMVISLQEKGLTLLHLWLTLISEI